MSALETIQCLKTIQKMLIDRGSNESEIKNTLKPYIDTDKTNENLNTSVMIPLDIINTTILFIMNSKSRLQTIKEYVENNLDRTFIIILRDKMNSTDEQKIHELSKNIQLFLLSEMQYNVSEHELVPKHYLITDDEEIKTIVDSYQLKSKHQLPIILKSDPMARYLNAKSGNLVKIERISPSSGINIVYRCCV